MDCSLPASFVHGISQAKILEWIAISFSRDRPHPVTEPASPVLQNVSYTEGGFFTAQPPGKAGLHILHL